LDHKKEANWMSDRSWDEMTNEEQIAALYGGEENMKNIRALTHEEVYLGQRAKYLSYLEWPNETESRREGWRKDIEKLDEWYASVSK
jgi:hypothetical protein